VGALQVVGRAGAQERGGDEASESAMAEPIPKRFQKRGKKEGYVACQSRNHAREQDGLKKCREKKKSGADCCNPANRERDGKRKEENLLVWQCSGESEKE